MTEMAKALALAGVLVAAATGCHSMNFEVAPEQPVAETVYHRKAFFIGGLAPTRQVDLSEYCPHGVVAVREETTFTDGLFNLITLAIYTPRSSWYDCAAEEVVP